MSHPHLERCTARRRSAHAREIGTAEAFTQPVPGGIPERIRRIATLHPSPFRAEFPSASAESRPCTLQVVRSGTAFTPYLPIVGH